MTRILKTLGLALASMAALVAVMAPAAQAETGQLTAEAYPAILTGPQNAGGFAFDIDLAGEPAARQVVCTTSDLEGTITGATDPVTLQPTYAGCSANPGAKFVTVTTNGCDYTFGFVKPGTTGWFVGTGGTTAALDCPVGMQIEIHVYENATKHTENVSMCTYDIGPQAAVGAGLYHNRAGAPKHVELTVSAQFTARSTIGAGGALCGGNALTGHLPITLTGTYTLRAWQDNSGVEGAQLGLDVG